MHDTAYDTFIVASLNYVNSDVSITQILFVLNVFWELTIIQSNKLKTNDLFSFLFIALLIAL
jgi:hypothetical protein